MKARDDEKYWIARHKKLRNQLAAVGHVDRSEAENVAMYARKKRLVADGLRDLGELDLAGKSVLDAGCGVGVMAEMFYVLGADVTGVDASPVAIKAARHRVPLARLEAMSLLALELETTFDLVFCIDVLYHVTDDENWEEAVRRLVRHVRPSGLLIILDQHKPTMESPASHVRYRTKAVYDDVVQSVSGSLGPPTASGRFLVYRGAPPGR